MNNHNLPHKERLVKIVTIFLAVVSVFFVVKVINEIKANKFIGSDAFPNTTIVVTGESEVFAVPDTAEFNFTVRKEALSVAQAQRNVTDRVDSVLESLEGFDVDEKDIKTTGYNVFPRYEFRRETVICVTFPCPQPPGKRTLVGYEISQTISVKVRNTEKAGQILGALGEIGVDNLSGLTFTIEDEDEFRRQARQEAIDEAQEKARELAKDLGVDLVRIVSFSEAGAGIPTRFFAATAELEGIGGGADTAPSIPEGENRIVSNVTITYEIR